MLNNKLPFSKSVLIFIILSAFATTLGIMVYFAVLKKYPPIAVQPTVKPATTPTTGIDITGWKTYKNEDVGIEFKYPETFGDIEVSYTDNTKYPYSTTSGKNINISFRTKEQYRNGFFYFNFSSNANENISSSCIEPLVYSEKGEVCKVIEVAGQKAVWRYFFSEGEECSSFFGGQISFKNKNASNYKQLYFGFILEDAAVKVNKLYDCSDEKSLSKVYAEAVIQSKNIMERKNLSEKDMKGLSIIDGILSSFKFIEKNDISDWKTYRNEKYGIEIKYPENWNILDEFPGNNTNSAIVSFKNPEISGAYDNIVISYYQSVEDYKTNSNAKTLNELAKSEEMTKIGELSIGKIKAIDVIEHGLWDSYEIFIEKNKHLYGIFFPKIPEKKYITDTEWKILSTFKFIK